MTDDVVAMTPPGRLRGARDGTRDALEYGATSPQPDRGITLIPEPVIAGAHPAQRR